MNSEYTNKGVFLRLLLFALFIGWGCYAFFLEAWEYAIPAMVLAFLIAWNLVHYINSVHRKLRFFFEAIKNEDGSIHFPETKGSKHLRALHQNMNRINGMITEIKVQQAHSERFFMEFMKRSATGLIAVAPDGFVEIVNSAALKLIGLNNLTHLNRLQQHNPGLYERMQNLKPGQSESVKVVQENVLKQISVKEARIRFSDKEYRIFSLYDIKAEMEENELETWQKLIRIMTHEIMNSIAPITSLNQTLSGFFIKKGQPIKVEELRQQEIDNAAQGLTVIGERAEGLRSFVDNYRKLSRLPQPDFKPINLSVWLESLSLMFQNQQMEHGIDFRINHTYTKPEFLGDEKLLTHVVLNLLNNAVEALEDRESKKISIITGQSVSGALQLRIIDNGKGFREDERDKIFLPFYTTRENGSGIGLSLSRQIMRLHKGSISGSSVVGEGSEFVVEI